MKKETKELVRLFGIAVAVMLAVALVYRICIYFWPPDKGSNQSLARFLEEVQSASCVQLITKPVGKWSDAEAQSEPDIYAWLKEQGNEILPWEWTEEARRKGQKGYAKCWRLIWDRRKSHCEKLLAYWRKEVRRLDRELLVVSTVHAHRTNQVDRLRAIAATNDFPCQVSLERLEKGRFWGWNKHLEMVECEDAAAAASICNRETATAQDEANRAWVLSDSLTVAKERSAWCGKLCEICDENRSQIKSGQLQSELMTKALIENLKRAATLRPDFGIIPKL